MYRMKSRFYKIYGSCQLEKEIDSISLGGHISLYSLKAKSLYYEIDEPHYLYHLNRLINGLNWMNSGCLYNGYIEWEPDTHPATIWKNMTERHDSV
ncbi:unnamed protein product [Dicrocoelium dendriticum]|nr:unnamed protein product [Dicrocoelium dendriticum]